MADVSPISSLVGCRRWRFAGLPVSVLDVCGKKCDWTAGPLVVSVLWFQDVR